MTAFEEKRIFLARKMRFVMSKMIFLRLLFDEIGEIDKPCAVFSAVLIKQLGL